MCIGNPGECVYHREILLNIGKQSSGEINDELQEELLNLGLLHKPGLETAVLSDGPGSDRGHQ